MNVTAKSILHQRCFQLNGLPALLLPYDVAALSRFSISPMLPAVLVIAMHLELELVFVAPTSKGYAAWNRAKVSYSSH